MPTERLFDWRRPVVVPRGNEAWQFPHHPLVAGAGRVDERSLAGLPARLPVAPEVFDVPDRAPRGNLATLVFGELEDRNRLLRQRLELRRFSFGVGVGCESSSHQSGTELDRAVAASRRTNRGAGEE